MSEEQLQGLVKASDHAGLREFFKGMPEGKRKAYAKLARQLYEDTASLQIEYPNPDWSEGAKERSAKRRAYHSHRKVAAFSALVACCPVSTVRAAHRDHYLMDCIEYVSNEVDPSPVDVLAGRAPEWLQSYIDWLVKQSGPWESSALWIYIWQFVRLGVVDRPQNPQYYRLFVGVQWMWIRRGRKTTLMDFVAHHANELEPELRSLFTVDEIVRGDDRSTGRRTWFSVLPVLAEQGVISREQLLRDSLHALNRDFREVQLRWYSKFHDALKPSIDERSRLEDEYRALLTNKVGTSVKLAVDALAELNKAGRIDAPALLGAINPTLSDSTKGVATAALRLLQAVAKKHPQLRTDAAKAAASALSHAGADINERAFELIVNIAEPSDSEVASAVRGLAEHTAPSVRAKIDDWLGQTPETASAPAPVADMKQLTERAAALPPDLLALAGLSLEPGGPVAHTLPFRRLQVPCLDPAARLEPIRDLDELVEVAMRQLVEPSDADEMERIYDGIARLGVERPPHFTQLTGQLLKQVNAENSQWADDVASAMRLLLDCWLHHRAVPRDPEPGRSLKRFLLERVGHISHRFTSGMSQGLLSFPTHRGGWIDPRILVNRALRLQANGAASDRIDWVLALHRLAPDCRQEALRNAAGVRDETGAALRYALGGWVEGRPTSSCLWAAASRARDPDAHDEEIHRAFPILAGEQVLPSTFEPTAERRRVRYGMEEAMTLDVAASPAMLDRTDQANLMMLYQSDSRRGRRVYSFIVGWALSMRWIASIWPMRREPYCALAASELGNNLDWIDKRWGNRAWYEPLLDPDCEMGPMATLLLAIGLASKQPAECGLATDILIAAIADGRLEGMALGECMGSLLFPWLIKLPRWAKTLAEAARVSPLHSREVRKAIERALADATGHPPTGLNTLLELLYQLSVEAGESVSDDRTRTFLEGLTGSSKLAKAARQLIALQPNPNSNAEVEADALAVLGRIERAERWAKWSDGVTHGQDS